MRASVRMLTAAVSMGVWWLGVTPLTEVPSSTRIERAPLARSTDDGKQPDPFYVLVGGAPHGADHQTTKLRRSHEQALCDADH